METDDPDIVNHAIEEYVGEPRVEGYSLSKYREIIDSCFDKSTVEEIIDALDEEGSQWSQDVIENLKKMSPSSLKVTSKVLKIRLHWSN